MTDFRAPIDQNKQTAEKKEETVISPAVEPVKVDVVPVADAKIAPTQPVSVVVQNTEMKEWPLDRFIKKLVHFIARLSWQPDPITWEKSAPTMSGNVAQKVWDTANKTIEKVWDVAKKTVEVTSNVTQKAVDVTQKAVETTTSAVNVVREIKNDISNTEKPVTQPLESLDKPE